MLHLQYNMNRESIVCERHLFYTSDQESRNSYMTDEIPCNSGKSLLLQGILLLVHTEMRSENRPQVTVLRSVQSSAFRASMSRGSIKNYYIISLKTPTAISFELLGRPEENLRAIEGGGHFCTVFTCRKRGKEYDHEKRGGSIWPWLQPFGHESKWRVSWPAIVERYN